MRAVSTYSGPQNLPPQPVAGHTWHLVGSHLMTVSNYPTAGGKTEIHYAWALVPDEAPQSSPTDADIDRRVQLLREAAVFHELPFTTPRDYCTVDGKFYRRHWAESARTEWRETDEATFAAGLRATAIRELLRERGGK